MVKCGDYLGDRNNKKMSEMRFKQPIFALMGAAGYVAPRHLEAIKSNQGDLLVAMDPNDSVGVLDRYFPEAKFFTSFERFERFVFKQRDTDRPIDIVSICSPNHLHDTHCRFALMNKAHAICEKPLVLRPSNLQRLREAEAESGKRIFCILQLRHHSKIKELKASIGNDTNLRHQLSLTYITSRGPWYHISWKGNEEKSGGVLFNIGIHFFDMLIYVFGPVIEFSLDALDGQSATGKLSFKNADVSWKLSTDKHDLPVGCEKPTFREIKINNESVEFSDGFTDLHSESYRAILAGDGFGLDDVAPSLDLVTKLRAIGVARNG